MNDQVEYLIKNFNNYDVSKYPSLLNVFVNELNELGKRGWDLFYINGQIYFFKRYKKTINL